MGYPTTDVTCGQPRRRLLPELQRRGHLLVSGTGAHASTGPIRAAWDKAGFLTGPIGYATGEVTCGLPQAGCYQDYQGGAIISSPGNGTRVSTGPIRSGWAALNFVDGPLGYPTGRGHLRPARRRLQAGLPGWGYLLVRGHRSARVHRPDPHRLGQDRIPRRAPSATPPGTSTCGQPGGGCYQDYQGGAIISSPGTGARVSTGPIRAAWAATGFLTGPSATPPAE